MLRRSILGFAALLPIGLLVDCTGTPGAVTFEQAKAYADAAIGAALAGSQQYLASIPPPSAMTASIVAGLANKLQAIKAEIDGTTTVPNWKAGAQEALAVLQQLSPMVAPFLGAAGPLLPVAIGVIEAFIAGLPTPADAPPTPPAALSRKAMEFHR